MQHESGKSGTHELNYELDLKLVAQMILHARIQFDDSRATPI